MRRYIVLGLRRDIEEWRLWRGLSPRDVIGVSTRQGHLALRGLGSGEYRLIVCRSWRLASDRVKVAVEQDLDILQRCGSTVD